MSTELLPCQYCGNEEGDTTTQKPLAMMLTNDDMVRCTNEACPIWGVPMTVKAWNRRFVCRDRKGDKVYSDSIIIGTMGDGSEHECDLRYEQHQWWAVNTEATFGVRMSFKLCEFNEIELIKENKE